MDELENSAIIDAVETGRLNEVRELIEEYLNWMLSTHPDAEKIREVLATQGVEAELADLAGHYERVWLATVENGAAGCVSFKKLSETTAELKRLFVSPVGRGHGLGRRLTQTALDAIREAGFSEVVLDTDPELTTAVAMYERMGFEYIDSYNQNPSHEALFMRLKL